MTSERYGDSIEKSENNYIISNEGGGWVTFKWKSLITEEKFNYFLIRGENYLTFLPFLRLMILFIRLRNKLARNNLVPC